MKSTLPIFNISFRPFFLLAAILAIVNVTLWVSAFIKGTSLGLINSDPLFWHGHEMLFGFTSALIIGFLFTASAHWTGTQPYRGNHLVFLIILWLVERLSHFIPLENSSFLVLLNIFYPASILLLFLKIKGHKQSFIFIPLLSAFWILSILHSYGFLFDHFELQEWSKSSASGLVRFLILLILGRVIPFFTRSRFKSLNLEITTPTFIQKTSILFLLIVSLPLGEFLYTNVILFIYGICILFNSIRLFYWRPFLGVKEPMIAILYFGVLSLVVSLFMEAYALVSEAVSFSQAPLHMLLASGLGSVAVGMMTRVSLGHTGREIKANTLILFSFSFVIIGGLVRVFVPILWNDYYEVSLHYASGFWTLGLILYLIKFSRPLFSKRPDGRIG